MTLLAASLPAAACAPTAEPAAPTTTTVPTTTTTEARTGGPFGGEAIVADDMEPMTLNPYAPGGGFSVTRIIGRACSTGVYDIDGRTLEMIPEVVTELPTVSNGGVVVNEDGTMTVTYTIRTGPAWEQSTSRSGRDVST